MNIAKQLLLIVLALVVLGCNENKPEYITGDLGNSFSSDHQVLIFQDDQRQIYKQALPDGSSNYFAEIKTKAISGRFTIHLILDNDFNILLARIPSYIGGRGRGITNKQYTSQFIGKGPESGFTIGQDIDAVTGSTASSKAMSESVKKTIDILSGL